jgi:hypothetical protein
VRVMSTAGAVYLDDHLAQLRRKRAEQVVAAVAVAGLAGEFECGRGGGNPGRADDLCRTPEFAHLPFAKGSAMRPWPYWLGLAHKANPFFIS